MHEIKNLIGIAAIVLTFIGYVPYVRDVVRGKTLPHVYSWFLWGFVTFIAFVLQVSAGGGIGTYVTLAASVMCTVVFILGFRGGGKKDITKIDTLFFILALITLCFWLITKEAFVSTILITGIDLLGFAPTIRKSWNKPHTETLSFYVLNTIRFILAVVALQKYTLVTTMYPVAWIFGNGLFALLLLIRRNRLKAATIA